MPDDQGTETETGTETEAGTESTETTGTETSGEQSSADVDKWKAMSRKHEAEAKKLRADLEKLTAASQTEAEKAIAAAKAEGRKATLAEVGQRLAAAEIKAALTGVVPTPSEIVEDLNLARYVNDDGEVDSEAVSALRKKYEGFAGKKPQPDLKQGQRGSAPDKGQLTQADLARMTPEQISKARREGRLDDLSKGIGRTAAYTN